MKKNDSIQTIDISTVDSLESYLWHLGMMAISVNTLLSLQEKAERIGIFDEDETEASKTLKYQIHKLYVCIDDLIRMTSSRTNTEWSALLPKIIESARVAGKPNKTAPKKGSKKK